MLARWQALTERWWVKTSEMGSERSLAHSKKLAMWLPGRFPFESSMISSSSFSCSALVSSSTGLPVRPPRLTRMRPRSPERISSLGPLTSRIEWPPANRMVQSKAWATL